MTIKSPLLCFCLALLLSACGFHLRSSEEWPASLRHITISGNAASFKSQLQQELRSLGVKPEGNGPYELQLSQYTDSTQQQRNLSANLPTLSAYTITFTAALIEHKDGKKITLATRRFSASTTNIENKTVVVSTRPSTSTIHLVQQNLLQQMYYWLKSVHPKSAGSA